MIVEEKIVVKSYVKDLVSTHLHDKQAKKPRYFKSGIPVFHTYVYGFPS